MEQFRKLGLSEQILKSLKEHEFEEPSEIQEKTIETYNKTASNYSDSHFYEHFWIREFFVEK